MGTTAEKMQAVLAKAAQGGYDGVGEQESGGEQESSASESSQDESQQADRAGQKNDQTEGAQSSDKGERTRGADGKFQAGGNAAKAPPPVVQKVGELPKQPAAKPKQDAHGSDEGDIDPDNRETWKPTHRIPYERFSKVIDEREQLRQELAKRDRTIEILQTTRGAAPTDSRDTKQPAKPAASVYDELFGDQANPDDPVQRELAELRTWRQQQETREAEGRLDQAIRYVTDKYPDVDPEDVNLYIAQGSLRKGMTLDDIGEKLTAKAHRYMAKGAQSAAAAKPAVQQQATQQQTQQRQEPPPRPKPTGSAGASKSDKDGVNFADPDQRAKYLEQRLNGLGK